MALPSTGNSNWCTETLSPLHHGISIGEVPEDNFHPENQTIDKGNGVFEIWPIDIQGVERKWRYARQSIDKIRHGLKVVDGNNRKEIMMAQLFEKFKTNWVNPLYDAGTNGTQLLNNIVDSVFSFPKSLLNIPEILEPIRSWDTIVRASLSSSSP